MRKIPTLRIYVSLRSFDAFKGAHRFLIRKKFFVTLLITEFDFGPLSMIVSHDIQQ